MNQNTGKILIFISGIIFLLGIVIYFFGDKLNWIGRLPGDFRFEGKNTKVYFPIVTMLIISLLINAVLYVIRKFF
ncbi:MAG: DUF2905 domain-containing protein [Spirosomaceae bacterium]|nr:DUF2905 domain-containing protein [Spirosomataceae bacterium]